jgi:hypothetical protein
MKRALAAIGLFLLCAAAHAQVVVYDDATENGWSNDSFGDPGFVPNPNNTSLPHTGTKSFSIVPNNFNAIGLINGTPVVTATYPIIHFWVNGGAASNQNFSIFVDDKSAPLDGYIAGGSIAAGQWREVTVDVTQPPLSSAGYTQIYLQAQVDSASTVYFDDISLQAPAGPPPANAMAFTHDINTLPAVSPMVSDLITWQDSAGHPRSAVLAHDNAGVFNAGGGAQVYGEALRQFTYQLTDGSTRTADVTTYGNGGHGGIGYVVDHSNASNCVSDDSPLGDYFQYGTFTRVFEGRHHSIYRFTQSYPRGCPNQTRYIPLTIEWTFSTGHDNPLYSITYNIGPSIAADILDDDSRAPYGELNIDGDGSTDIDGVAWGDRFKFTSTIAPVTLSSSWTYNVANTVPYVKEWLAAPLTVDHKHDATIGLVQTQPIAQQDAGGARQLGFHDITVLWGNTSATNPANPNGYKNDPIPCNYTMPCQDEWAYQANADNLSVPNLPANPGSSNNARMTWRTQWGFLGQTTYVANDGSGATPPGYPRKSYSVYLVLGQHSQAPVEHQVTQIETVQSLTLSINNAVGSVVTSGPAGVQNIDNVTYVPAGYNHVRGALAFNASGNLLDANIGVGAGTLSKPLIIIGNYTAAVYPTVKLDGVTLAADAGYFGSLRADASELWITINQDLAAGVHHFELLGGGGGPGLPGAPSITQATPGNAQVTIAFDPPASDGGSPILDYTATCNPGGFNATGSSPIIVGGLNTGIQYSCTVTARNANGSGPASAPVLVTLLNNRSFVATTGNDANNCTTLSMCRSFGRAIAATYAGGEIIATNSGGYGSFSVDKAITVIGAPGGTASLSVGAGNGIDVAAASTDRVTLRGLNITMLSAATGINATGFSTLAIEDCSIIGGSYGIQLAGGAGSFAIVTNAEIHRPSTAGVLVRSHAAILDTTIEGSGARGLHVRDGVASDGVVSAVGLVSVANQTAGVFAESLTAGHQVALDLDHAMVNDNLTNGVVADGTGAGTVAVRITHSTVTENGAWGLAQAGAGVLQSLSNNLVAGNNNGDTTGVISPIAGH